MKKFLSFFSAVLVGLALCGGTLAEAKTRSASTETIDSLEVHYIDVGQGDATLIKCGGSAMLIDAGENDKGTFVQNYISKQGVKSLEYLIVTHPDSDHCGGADVIINKYDIDTIIMPDYAKDTQSYRDVIQALDHKRYKITSPVVGTVYQLGDAEFTVIAPSQKDYGDEANNYSVGIILEHGDKKFVFTGDAEEEAEADMLRNRMDLSADVLKVGHHGSKTSSSEAFIDAVSPEYAVISCEENNEYGHPHSATLNILRSAKIKVFCTDEQGSLAAVSDGKEITWNAAPSDTWKAGEPVGSGTGKTLSAASAEKVSGEKMQTAEVQKNQYAAPAIEEEQALAVQDTQGLTYVLNVKTKKFHKPTCGSLPTTNRSDSTLSRDEIMAQGYVPCKKCNP